MFGKKRAEQKPLIERRKMDRYLSPVDVWAIAFGCSVGWGAFVMPATTFLPVAGPAGTLVAILAGTALMLIIGYNYAWLMQKRPRKGGVYTYTREAFGRDHAFLCSWFLSLSYLTVVFLNATALFIISRVVFEDFPQIGFRYHVAGHVIYPGEIALSVLVLVVTGILLIREKPFMQAVQRILALILLAGVVILTVASLKYFHWAELLHSFGTGGFGALWGGAKTAGAAASSGIRAAASSGAQAAVSAGAGAAAAASSGMRAAASSSAQAAVSAGAGAAAAASSGMRAAASAGAEAAAAAGLPAVPSGLPTLASAEAAGGVSAVVNVPGLRSFGAVLTIVLLAPWAFVGFDVASLETPHFDFPIRKSVRILMCAILSAAFVYAAMTFTSVSFIPPRYSSWQAYIGDLENLEGVYGVPTFYAAQTVLGRAGLVIVTITALAAILTGVIGAYRATVRMLSTMAEDRILSREFNGTTFSIIFIMAVSSFFAFLGRNTLNWFVELTSFGATVGFAYTSAAAARIASREGTRSVEVTGIIGAGVSGIFAIVQLASRVASVETMGAPAFLLLAVWCLLGFIFYWRTMRQSELSDFEGVTASSAVLFCLLFYSVLMWFFKRLTEAVQESGLTMDDAGTMNTLRRAIMNNGAVTMLFVVVGLLIMLLTQGWLRKRQAQLEREKIHAEESNKAKSQFLFNMSHDIRTPMNAIIGYTHLAGLEKDVPPKVREYIEKIDISGKHLLTLINDVLEMSRIESGKMELESEPGNICEALQTAFEMFRDQMEEKKITYRLDIRDVGDPYVRFDRNRYLRVILNLVSNAYKFTPEGGNVTISMTQIGTEEGEQAQRLWRAESARIAALEEGIAAAGRTADDAGQPGKRKAFSGKKKECFAGEDSGKVPAYGIYEIRVKDDGIGMTKEFAEIVFEAFARERTSTVSRIQGTGLGMAITKSIVDVMQGSIDVVTAPDEGTEFIIRVPYAICDAQTAAEQKAAENQAAAKKAMAETAAADRAAQKATAEKATAQKAAENQAAAKKAMAETAAVDRAAQKATAEKAAAEKTEPENTAAKKPAAETTGARSNGAETADTQKIAAKKTAVDTADAGTDGSEKAPAKRLLVAEDMEINRQILGMLLQNIGYEADMAQDGKEAVDKIAASEPGFYGAVLMDIQMPVMDGYEATRKIRQLENPALAGIPIIAVTANAFGEDVRKAHAVGMDAHISKPIDPDQLALTLDEVLV